MLSSKLYNLEKCDKICVVDEQNWLTRKKVYFIRML